MVCYMLLLQNSWRRTMTGFVCSVHTSGQPYKRLCLSVMRRATHMVLVCVQCIISFTDPAIVLSIYPVSELYIRENCTIILNPNFINTWRWLSYHCRISSKFWCAWEMAFLLYYFAIDYINFQWHREAKMCVVHCIGLLHIRAHKGSTQYYIPPSIQGYMVSINDIDWNTIHSRTNASDHSNIV